MYRVGRTSYLRNAMDGKKEHEKIIAAQKRRFEKNTRKEKKN